MTSPSDHPKKSHRSAFRIDWLLWFSSIFIITLYVMHLHFADVVGVIGWLHELSHSVFELMNTIWWGIMIGILMISILGRIPREFVTSVLGTGQGFQGILRATLAGLLLDLCSHGILMVGAKLYERGASIGQVIAFLVSSPWNSFSLTLILIALIGLPWTLAFIVLSMMIAIATGLAFDRFARIGILPTNQNQQSLPADFEFWAEAKIGLRNLKITPSYIGLMLLDGLKESRMVIRWILFGVLLASFIRAIVPPGYFETYFGPTFLGLAITIVVATILEVCSEGSTPIAADILTRANAPGNSFAFLMGGVSTDYTEIMILRETTKSLRIALFLPLITLPMVIVVGGIINTATP